MNQPRPLQPSPALFTDLYELTMLQAYLEEDLLDEAVFSLFVRRLPDGRNYLLAAGLDDVLRYLEELRFDGAALEYLASTNLFSAHFLGALESFRFEGDVYAVPEGTPVFANEPLLEVVASLPQGQFVETFLLNQCTLQTVLASKASRIVAAAQGRSVIDFGLRRTHGLDAGLKSARAFHIAGVHGTSNVAAGQVYGIPVHGTMAHSFVQAHDHELAAFREFVKLYPETVLLVDTYDTLQGVASVIALAKEQGAAFKVRAIRLDSGDLGELSREARRLLDQAGLRSVQIFASSGLNENHIDHLLRHGAPIDAFGVGGDMAVSDDAPSLEMVYKLTEFRGRGRTKLSEGKSVLPGRKQVFRIEEDGKAVRDVIARVDEGHPGRPLLVPVMREGKRLPDGTVSLHDARAHAQNELSRLPPRIRVLMPADPAFPVEISRALRRAHTDVIADVQASRR
jgi:nicotinate phosphoribosyltransferase